jgi:hypothetical protein
MTTWVHLSWEIMFPQGIGASLLWATMFPEEFKSFVVENVVHLFQRTKLMHF